jgi:electron transport complex protein RnfG
MANTENTRNDLRRNTRAIVLPMVSLVSFAALGTALVMLTANLTDDRITKNRTAQAIKVLTPLLPADGYDNEPHLDTIALTDAELLGSAEPQQVYRVRRNNQPVAAIMTVTAPSGYIGPIQLLVAIDTNGRLLGVRTLEHMETPGLGDKIEISKNNWILGFDGHGLGNPPTPEWLLTPDGGKFDQITGATITSRTIVSAVRDALLYFAEHQAEIFALPGETLEARK